jgi:hypothetical protein
VALVIVSIVSSTRSSVCFFPRTRHGEMEQIARSALLAARSTTHSQVPAPARGSHITICRCPPQLRPSSCVYLVDTRLIFWLWEEGETVNVGRWLVAFRIPLVRRLRFSEDERSLVRMSDGSFVSMMTRGFSLTCLEFRKRSFFNRHLALVVNSCFRC